MDLIERAKNDGLNVTCEVAPHHFTLTDEAVMKYGTNAKMNPPLRSQVDVDALISAMQRGIVDAIATDHAPHDFSSKNTTLAQATFGIVGVETMLPLSLALYHQGKISLMDVLNMMTYRASKVLNLGVGAIEKGASAALCLIDLDRKWVHRANDLHSISKNTPFDGWEMQGKAVMTLYAGDVVFKDNI